MNNLTRWNPYREMLTLREQFNRLFDDTLFGPSRSMSPFATGRWGLSTTGEWGLEMDVRETEDNFVIQAPVPGFDPEQLEITLERNVLTIKGELQEEDLDDNDVYHMREMRYGQFCRSITLPSDVDPDAVEAHSENGILTVTVPKTEESKPKRIPITEHGRLTGNGNGQKVIQGEAT